MANNPKVTLIPGQVVRTEMRMEVENVSLVDVGVVAQENDPFAKLGYVPDRWKAYMDFDIVHCMPAIIGPVSEGFYCTYLPDVVEASHASLLHQQVNLNHLLKAYSGGEGDEAKTAQIAKDRIVGCVVATSFPPKPMTGWKIGDDPKTAPSIRARAVIFKLADGVNRIIGDHQASRKKQSVSIETVTNLGNLGIYLPSRGPDQIVPLLEVKEDEILNALKFDPLSIGTVNGEQAVFVYGMKNPVEFRGVGMTPRPAEYEARIISFEAKKSTTADGATVVAMAAERVNDEIVGNKVRFKTGRTGKIKKVYTEGEAKLPGMTWGIKATTDDPVLEIGLGDRTVLLRMGSVAGQIVS